MDQGEGKEEEHSQYPQPGPAQSLVIAPGQLLGVRVRGRGVLGPGTAGPGDLLRLLLPVRAWNQLLQAADLGVVDGLVLLKHMVRIVVGLFAQVLEKGG